MNTAEAWGVMAGLRKSAREMAARLGEPEKMTEAEKVLRFMLAGRATFTIVSRKTGERFTFEMRANRASDSEREKPRLWFVSVLTGASNTSDYTFLGTVRDTYWNHGRRSSIGRDAPSAKAFAWFWSRIVKGHMPETCDFYHEGRCGRCGRKLTVPESIQTGLGPECGARS